MMLDHGKYRIVWNSPRGHGHLFSLEENNIVCSLGGRKGPSLIERALHVETMRPERAYQVTCSKCRTKIVKYDPTFLNRELESNAARQPDDGSRGERNGENENV